MLTPWELTQLIAELSAQADAAEEAAVVAGLRRELQTDTNGDQQ